VPQRAVVSAVEVGGDGGVVHQRQAATVARHRHSAAGAARGVIGCRVAGQRARRVRPDPQQARVQSTRPEVFTWESAASLLIDGYFQKYIRFVAFCWNYEAL
jgi:hypothetical protein